MAVILSWRSHMAEWVSSGARCSICDGDLQPPFLHWVCEAGEKDISICTRCCHDCRRGLTADSVRTVAIAEGLRPSPDCPTLQTVQ
jgi:hypothetical protein